MSGTSGPETGERTAAGGARSEGPAGAAYRLWPSGVASAGDEGRDRAGLVLLWVLGWGAALWAWPERPPLAHIVAVVGTVALAVLLGRMLIAQFSGYERFVGLRILGRSRAGAQRPGDLRWLWLGIVVVGLGALLWLKYGLAAPPWVTRPQDAAWWNVARLGLVFAVAIASFLLLFAVFIDRLSVFGTLSIFGVVFGVAALLVVQSVATGFQHEFERRVTGVYGHINVTRPYGMPEYRRFEAWLRTLPGVAGASPFVYEPMAIAAVDRNQARGEDVKFASVLVKGIEPNTAGEVIDIVGHLRRGSGREVALAELTSPTVLAPVLDRPDVDLPEVIATTPDPRGIGAYDRAMDEYERVLREDPERVADFDLRPRVDADDWADPQLGSDTPDERDVATMPTMFIGKTLADDLSLVEGDVVRLVDPGASFDTREEPRFRYYVIRATFEAGFYEYDSRLVYVDIRELERFKYRGQDIVSGIDLRLSDPDDAPIVGATIRAAIGDEYSVLEWQKLNENLFSSIRTQKNVITIVLSLVIVVASFNVLSSLWTMVLRRTPEVAILMSMGGSGAQIGRIFQVTGTAIGLAGSVAGVALGLLICLLVELYGYGLDPEVYFIDRLPVEISLAQITGILGFSLLICFLATIPPSIYASRLRPVEGLRYE